MSKLKSRKLWISIAALLGSIGSSIAGLCTGSDIVAAIGVVCAMLSAAIYAVCEAWVDAERAEVEAEIREAELENGEDAG